MLSIRTVRAGVALVCLAALLPSCSGDGNFEERVNFGINGAGQCDNMVVDVDIAGAFAVLAHTSDGSIDCRAHALLDSACNISFAELDSGRTLRVTIDDCAIPPTTGLFDCGFSKIDVGLMQTQMDAECSCTTNRCDDTPPMCASRDDDPYFCENCSDGKDNDDDRLVDCSDPNCDHSYECAASTTTTSTTFETTLPSTTSTSSTTSTTSSTLPGDTTTTTTVTTTTIAGSQNVIVVFHVDSATGVLGSMQLRTDYTNAPGEFVGSGAAVECTNKVDGALFAPNDFDDTHDLRLGIVALTGFSAPKDIVECLFHNTPPDSAVASDFSVVVEDATDADGNPLTATVSVNIKAAP
ncbi:MAG TPA: hypothetical protein VN634_06755 [Candidatus Limnocylindrales bacterium]|nr:hypothetical protein [Candidatus Limnocylindrales bacterium]